MRRSAGDLRVYNEQHLVSVTKFKSPVNAMTFGKFGREENTLISITRTGPHMMAFLLWLCR